MKRYSGVNTRYFAVKRNKEELEQQLLKHSSSPLSNTPIIKSIINKLKIRIDRLEKMEKEHLN